MHIRLFVYGHIQKHTLANMKMYGILIGKYEIHIDKYELFMGKYEICIAKFEIITHIGKYTKTHRHIQKHNPQI